MTVEAELLACLQGRRDVQVQQALSVLALFPGAEVETRRSLLSIAGRSLADPAVRGRWLELALEERDRELLEPMVLRLLGTDPGSFPDPQRYLQLLGSALRGDVVRLQVLAELGRLAPAHPEALELLIRAYPEISAAGQQRALLLALCRWDAPPERLVEFFLSVIDRVDADVKAALVARLLRAGAAGPELLARWLSPEEPEAVKLWTLEHLQDRSIELEPAVTALFSRDASPECRRAAVRTFAAQGRKSPQGVSALLDALDHEPDPDVAESMLLALFHGVELTPEILALLAGRLAREKHRDQARRLLRVLGPRAAGSAAVRRALLELAAQDLHAEVAVELHACLGRLAAWDPEVYQALLAAYESSRSDRVRAALLEVFAARAGPDDRLDALYAAALSAPAPAVRGWGMAGLLLLPMTPDRVEEVARGAALLTDALLPIELRRAVARKVARIPAPAPGCRAQLQRVLEQSDDGALREICRTALDRALAAPAGEVAVDWDLWRRRVTVEHSVDGIFPEVYVRYESNPAAARELLEAALLDPQCGDSLYHNGVSGAQILRFLQGQQALDDDLCRYCLSWVLEKDGRWGDPNLYLSVLEARPDFPPLREELWLLFQDRRKIASLNPVLLRELLALVHGGDEEAGRELAARLGRQVHPAGAAPYLAFLCANLLWEPAAALLVEASAREGLQDAETRALVRASLAQLGLAVKLPEPGFLDE